MMRLFVAIFIVFGPTVVRAQATWPDNQFPNGHCTSGAQQTDPAPWLVDPTVVTALNGIPNSTKAFSSAESATLVEFALSNLARQGRFRMRAAASAGTCSDVDFDTRPCVIAKTNAADGDCGAGALGHGGCSGPFGCWFILCTNNITATNATTGANLWETGDIMKTLTHEIGHAIGLKHTSNLSNPPPVPLPNCSALPPAESACTSTSDGCDGELMCPVNACIMSPFVTQGDGDGLRAVYGPARFTRGVYFGSDIVSDGMAAPATTAFSSQDSNFAPRIDCSKQTSPTPTNRCAAAWESVGTLKVARLNGAVGSAGWTTQTVISIAQTGELPPDIAINDAGTIAYVLRTDGQQIVHLLRVLLDGSGFTEVSLDQPAPNVFMRATLPPRIAFADGVLHVLIYDSRIVDATHERLGNPALRLITVSANLATTQLHTISPVPPLGISFDDFGWVDFHTLTSDFDFDCITSAGVAKCTVVAQFSQDDVNEPMDRTKSIRFQQDGQGVASMLDNDWDTDSNNNSAVGVIGVSLSPSNLFVSVGRQIQASTANTRVNEYSGARVGGAIVSGSQHLGDAVTSCPTGSAYGVTFGAATMHGGYSISNCTSCRAGSTSLESVQFGLPTAGDSDVRCY